MDYLPSKDTLTFGSIDSPRDPGPQQRRFGDIAFAGTATRDVTTAGRGQIIARVGVTSSVSAVMRTESQTRESAGSSGALHAGATQHGDGGLRSVTGVRLSVDAAPFLPQGTGTEYRPRASTTPAGSDWHATIQGRSQDQRTSADPGLPSYAGSYHSHPSPPSSHGGEQIADGDGGAYAYDSKEQSSSGEQ